MKHSVFSLLGLIMTVSAEASHVESLHTFSDVDSRQSFCSSRCEVLKENLQSKAEQLIADIKAKLSEEKRTDFSLPTVAKCQTDHYSFFGKNFIRTKLSSGTEILFPTDGYQMSPEEVVQLSGANLDDGLVTKFYMAIFGLIKWEGEYLEMGFDEDNKACRIFDLSRLNQKTRRAFTTNFRKIASNSVGRTLLYRLLLEIRRTNAEGSGCIDDTLNISLASKDAKFRNNARMITIEKADEENAFSCDEDGHSFIEFFASRDTETSNVVDFTTGKLIEKSRGDDNALFHEMLHWFHSLQDPERKGKEIKLKTETSHKSDIYMGNEKLKLWAYREYGQYFIKMEEFRTIMGEVVEVSSKGEVIYSPKPALYGDDLSENLYRFGNRNDLRYGHNIKPNQCVSQKIMTHMQTSYAEIFEAGGYKFNKH